MKTTNLSNGCRNQCFQLEERKEIPLRGIRLLQHAFKMFKKVLNDTHQEIVDTDKTWYEYTLEWVTNDAVFITATYRK